MNFIKNFGGAGGASTRLGANAPGSSKSAYFKSLNLGDENENQKVKGKEKQGKKMAGPPKGFIPQKFALDFDKPSIILEYRDPQTKKLYHHRMALKKLTKETPSKTALDFLRKKHNPYFAQKVMDEAQIEKLIDRLKNGLLSGSSEMGDVEQEDFDFDYQDDDFDD